MTHEELAHLGKLAARLHCAPRELLVVAARAVDAGASGDVDAMLAMLQKRDPGAVDAQEACATLLLAPVSSYANDELDNLLATLWREDAR